MATNTLLSIPRTLLVSKQSSNVSASTKKVIAAASTSKRGSSSSDKCLSSYAVVLSSVEKFSLSHGDMSCLEALIVRSNAEVLSLNAPADTSFPVHMPSQRSIQPEDSSSPVDMQIQQSIQSENMHPQFNCNGGHYNWGMQQLYWTVFVVFFQIKSKSDKIQFLQDF